MADNAPRKKVKDVLILNNIGEGTTIKLRARKGKPPIMLLDEVGEGPGPARREANHIIGLFNETAGDIVRDFLNNKELPEDIEWGERTPEAIEMAKRFLMG